MNFGGEEVVYGFDESEIVILPVPYDATSSWQRGSQKGPHALLEASVNLEWYDLETDTEVQLRGIHTLPPLVLSDDPALMVEMVKTNVLDLLNAGKFPVTIGGNHSVSIGAIKAAAQFYGEISVLQLDAHADMRESYLGSPFNHASAMARAREVAHTVQVGIRSVAAEELENTMAGNIFPAQDLYYHPELYKEAASILRPRVYITIDLDAFDPSIMPSTGTPEPGGLLWYEVIDFLRLVASTREIVGFDIVELLPDDSNKAPDFMAAKLLYKLLTYKFL